MGIKFSRNRVACYCAFCRTPRTVYQKKRLGISNVILCLAASALMSFVIWFQLDPRALFFFVIFLAITETFLQLRWRMSMHCQSCGFDPVLYLKDPKLAADKVKLRLDHRKSDPTSLFTAPLNIPTVTKARAEVIQVAESGKKGSFVSKQA